MQRVYFTKNMSKATKMAFATRMYQMSILEAEVKADVNLTLAKLDLDAGVTDTNYAASNPIAGTVPSIL
jgi:hypothetical protein